MQEEREMGIQLGLHECPKIVDIPSLPSLQGSRDACKVEDLHPHLLTVFPGDLGQFLRHLDLSFLRPKIIGCLLQSLRHFLSCLSYFLGPLQLCFQLQDQLFLCGQLYLSMIELFTLILSLVLGIFQTGLSALPRPLLHGQLSDKFLVFLLSGSQGLVVLGMEVASPLASFLASLTHSLGTKTFWTACT